MKARSNWTWMVMFGLVAGLVLTSTTRVQAGEEEGEKSEAKALCPVMDEPVDPSVWTATDDGPVLFCCGGCIKKYKKDPEKYAEKTAALREAMEKMPKAQVTCPISGEPVDTKVFTEKDGKKVYFCCEKCQGKYDAEPAKYKVKLANSYSYQPSCPFSGDPIDPSVSAEFTTGQKVYFCCGKCKAKFVAAPEEHVEDLKKIGIYVKPDKLKKDS